MAKKRKQRNEGQITAMLDAAIERGDDLANLTNEIKTEYESRDEVRARRTKEKAEREKAKERAAKK